MTTVTYSPFQWMQITQNNTYRRPRFSCDARNALLPLMAHGPWVSWNPWNSSCPVGSLDTFGTKFSPFSWL